MDPIHISGKNLATLCLEDPCYRCFARSLKMRFRRPLPSPVGALYNYMETIQKKVILESLDNTGRVPKWFGPLDDATAIVEVPRQLSYYDKATNVELVGRTDMVFSRPDGTVMVIDLKTGRHKGDQDPLFALYRGQVNSYGFLLEKQEEAPEVSKAGLLHFEVDLGVEDDSNPPEETESGLLAHFRANPVEVELIHDELIPALLKKVNTIFSLPVPPEGKAGCKDCALLDSWVKLVNSEITDARAMVALVGERKAQTFFDQRQYDLLRWPTSRRTRLPDTLTDIKGNLGFDPNGVIANWDFD